MTRPRALLFATLLAATPVAAIAASAPTLDLPAGTLGQAVAVLGRQAGISVAIGDDGLWSQRVPAIKERGVAAALARLTRMSGARLVAIDAVTWRIDRPVVRRAIASAPAVPTLFAMRAAVADDAPIVVTATKRGFQFANFAGTATRLDGNDLSFGGEGGSDSVLGRLASISSTHLGDGRNKLFIRGIADSSFTGPTQATVGQYLGDVRLTYNAPDPDLRLYDVAAVEVLEGPQGTLYGAGSLGGILRIVRNPPRLGEPEASISAGVSATQHGDPSGDVGGMVNLPLVKDKLGLRMVGYGITEGGYIDDVERHLDNINRTRTAGGRIALRLDAGDDWIVDLGGTLQSIRGDDSQYADRGRPLLTHASAIAQGFDADYRLGDLVVTKAWDGVRLVSSTGIASQTLAERFDATTADIEDRVFDQRNHTSLITNETRLWRPLENGFGWTLGGSLLHNRARLKRSLGPLDAPAPVTGVANTIDEATLFGEASVVPLAGLTITGGARLSRSKLSGGVEDVPTSVEALAKTVELARESIVASRTHTRVLPSLSATLKATRAIELFARYGEGFRPGGLSVDTDFVRRFQSDRVATIEAGVRTGVTGKGDYDLAATVSRTRWRDIQADFIDGNGLPTTANIGDGRIYSFAVTGGWRPMPGLSIDAAVIVNDSKVTSPDIQSLVGVALLGAALPIASSAALADGASAAAPMLATPLRRIPNVARVTARLGIDYHTALNDTLDLRIGASARYTGTSRLGVGPLLGEAQGNYLDTALTARVGRPELGLTLALTNLADSTGNRFALGTPYQSLGADQITPLRPRTLRLGIDARF
ncbi:TonB-dependent receptor [Sphingosinicellaceae bacterium]|nr:TonB-dependent receptor [Sphingosinicellaceae bacterium]